MLLEEVAAYLQAQGHPSSNLGALPSTPDDAFALYEYGSSPPVLTKNQQAPVYELARFQVITRSKSYTTARIKIERIYRALSGYSGVLEGVTYFRIAVVQSPFFLDRDDIGRARFVCKFEAQKDLSPLP